MSKEEKKANSFEDYPSHHQGKRVMFYFACPYCSSIPLSGMAMISKKKRTYSDAIHVKCRNPECNLLTFGEGLRNYFKNAGRRARIREVKWTREDVHKWTMGYPINDDEKPSDE